MKGLNVLAAFLGGAAVGAALGILFAPEKGEDTRNKIAEILRKKGIKLNRNEMENLVDEIAAEIKGEIGEYTSPKAASPPGRSRTPVWCPPPAPRAFSAGSTSPGTRAPFRWRSPM